MIDFLEELKLDNIQRSFYIVYHYIIIMLVYIFFARKWKIHRT